MQRVNIAYDNRNLLALSELQLEVEQIDQSMISTISDDRLKHYLKLSAFKCKPSVQSMNHVI